MSGHVSTVCFYWCLLEWIAMRDSPDIFFKRFLMMYTNGSGVASFESTTGNIRNILSSRISSYDRPNYNAATVHQHDRKWLFNLFHTYGWAHVEKSLYSAKSKCDRLQGIEVVVHPCLLVFQSIDEVEPSFVEAQRTADPLNSLLHRNYYLILTAAYE